MPQMVLARKWASQVAIHRQRAFDIRPPAASYHLKHTLNIKWNMAKLDTKLFAFRSDKSILRPRISMKLVLWKLPVVREANTARIHVPGGIIAAAELLRVGVTTRQKCCILIPQKPLELLF